MAGPENSLASAADRLVEPAGRPRWGRLAGSGPGWQAPAGRPEAWLAGPAGRTGHFEAQVAPVR